MKLVLDFLQVIKELRDLSILEWNFRDLLNNHLQSLLKQQRLYWKQRGQIKWVTLGDASTKIFHANATIKYRRNLITSLKEYDGNVVVDHSQNANMIWQSFKDRLEKSKFTGIQFNLDSIIQPDVDLNSLVT